LLRIGGLDKVDLWGKRPCSRGGHEMNKYESPIKEGESIETKVDGHTYRIRCVYHNYFVWSVTNEKGNVQASWADTYNQSATAMLWAKETLSN
jgi:hypothetical protein